MGRQRCRHTIQKKLTKRKKNWANEILTICVPIELWSQALDAVVQKPSLLCEGVQVEAHWQ